MNFQDKISSIPIGILKGHYVLVLDLNSIQYDTENRHYPEVVGEPLRLELNFTFPLKHVKHVTNLIVSKEQTSSVAADMLGVVEKNIQK